MDSLSVNNMLEVMSFLSRQDCLGLRTLNKSFKSKIEKCSTVLCQNMQREIEELNASPLYAEYLDKVSLRLELARDGVKKCSRAFSQEMKSLGKPGKVVGLVCRLAAFIVLRETTKLCTWQKFKKVISTKFLSSLVSVDEEYLCIPSVQDIIGEYFDDPNNSLANVMARSTTVSFVYRLISTMRYQHAGYARAQCTIHKVCRVYSRIAHLKTNPPPPRPAPSVATA